MTEHNEELEEKIAEGVVTAIIKEAEKAGLEPDDVVIGVLVKIFIGIANGADSDSLLVTLRKMGDGWQSHIHLDYLDADPEHIDRDLHWQRGDSLGDNT
ncbi:MAG TPA: hypothetical protein VIY48_19475 [Candidatus Paceibacterota bacterium]